MTDSLSHHPVCTFPPIPRHSFGEPRRVGSQVERACVCGVVKITVFGANGSTWREWRLPGDPVQYNDALGTPPCTSELREP